MSRGAMSRGAMSTGIPRYVRPRPDRVGGLTSTGWSILLVVAGVLTVEAASRLGLISTVDLVPVTVMAGRAAELVTDPAFLTRQLLPTLGLIAAGFAAAAVLGVAVGLLLWRSPWWSDALQPYLNIYYAIPTFAVYPILVVLFGTGPVPILLLATAFSVVVIIANALIGFRSVPVAVDKLARANRLGRRAHLTKILLPAAVPDIAAGLRLGLVYATIAVLATEFILATRGLGHFISQAYHTFHTVDMYAGILLICLVALVLNLGVGAVLSRLDWRQR
ncbi:MAG: ABC transporter permease subunit [Streptosporangiales bacterium]|nr:ABC transporter permease subunit [Streptosporangiales bacterium]